MEIIMEREKDAKEILETIAREKVQKIKNFYIHLFIYCIGVILYVLKTYCNVPINFFPIRFINAFFMWCWTFVIAVQGIRLFLGERFLGTQWEEEKVKQIMDEERIKKQNWK